MKCLKNLKESFRAIVFKENAIKKISIDKNSSKFAIIKLLILGLIGASVLNLNQYLPSRTFIIIPILTLIFFSIEISVFNFISKTLFKGKGNWIKAFRALGNTYIMILWFAVAGLFWAIKFKIYLYSAIFLLVGIWIFSLYVFTANKVYKHSLAKSIGIVAISLVLIFLVLIVSGMLMGFLRGIMIGLNL